MTKVSIIIKTLNEESNIRRAVESSLAAAKPYGGEVIVADSASRDRTVAIAAQFAVSIVRLEHPEERCCGIGPQLGYEHSSGQYIYILDGDMDLQLPFLNKAVEILDREPAVAGVGGYIHEMRTENLEVRARVRRIGRLRRKSKSEVDCLNGGGLYRRSAIAEIGYLSDRNLHAFEEYDLGARLRVKGWRLVRLEDKAVDHYSYSIGTWRLLWHRMGSGRFLASGELLRAAMAGHYVGRALREVRILPIALGVWLYWCVVISAYALTSRATVFLAALAIPVLIMGLRARSLKQSLFSVLNWHMAAVGFLLGFCRPRRSPLSGVASRVLQTAGEAGRRASEGGAGAQPEATASQAGSAKAILSSR
ncbi:MAG TPA: glycosyltransferase [Xanthobacteraceae bacterium]|nr:glycosyltransferase [Xanthobacteraceae bacterium]